MNESDLIKILLAAKDGKFPSSVSEGSGFNMHLFSDLVEEGYIEAIDISSKSGVGYLEPRLTLRGMQYYDEILGGVPKQPWYKSFQDRVSIYGIAISLIGLVVAVIALNK